MIQENEFILEVCKIQYSSKEKIIRLINEGINYPYVLGQLLYNRVGGIAYYVLKKHEILHMVSREFRNSLEAVYEFGKSKASSYIQTLQELEKNCEKFDFRYAFLKGALLVNLYPTGLRTSNDVDILINPEDISGLSAQLKEAGFRQGSIKNEVFVPAKRNEIIFSRMNRGETIPYVKEVNLPCMKYLEIDVNFSLGFSPGNDEDVVGTFLERTQNRILNSVYSLNSTDFLMHLCAHLYKEAVIMNWIEMGRDISLYKYCDIYLYLNQFINKEFADGLIKGIKECGLEKECYYSLYNAKKLFDIDNIYLEEILRNIKPNDVKFMKEVFEPLTGKLYSYSMDYIDWVFCGNRRENLNEVKNEEK